MVKSSDSISIRRDLNARNDMGNKIVRNVRSAVYDNRSTSWTAKAIPFAFTMVEIVYLSQEM
jgi:hypothetical protein